MNKLTIRRTAAVFLFALMGITTILMVNGCDKNSGGSMKVGVNLSLTGSSPYWSAQIKRGLEIATEEVSKNNQNGKLEVIYEDNQGQAKNAISICQKFATVDKVAVILTAHTYIAKPQQPLAEQYKIPLLATVVSAVGFGKENPWSFLDWPSHDEITPPVADYAAQNLNAKSAVTLVVNDEYGTDGAAAFKAEFEKKGGAIVGQETFGNTDKDIRSQLTKLLRSKPQVLYTVAREDSLIAVVKQARELGFKGYIVGVNAFDSPIAWKGLGDQAEGIIFGGIMGHAGGNADAAIFESEYEKRFGEKPDWVAFYGYTIGKYLFPIILQTKGDRDKIREALSTLKVSGARGMLEMSKDRKILSKGVVYIRKGGRNVLVGKAQ